MSKHCSETSLESPLPDVFAACKSTIQALGWTLQQELPNSITAKEPLSLLMLYYPATLEITLQSREPTSTLVSYKATSFGLGPIVTSHLRKAVTRFQRTITDRLKLSTDIKLSTDVQPATPAAGYDYGLKPVPPAVPPAQPAPQPGCAQSGCLKPGCVRSCFTQLLIAVPWLMLAAGLIIALTYGTSKDLWSVYCLSLPAIFLLLVKGFSDWRSSRTWSPRILGMLGGGLAIILLLVGITFYTRSYESKCWDKLAADANLQRCNFQGAGLSERDLHGVDLSYAVLSKANLSQANLAGADLTTAELQDADLQAAILDDADLTGANLSNANLAQASLHNVTWAKAKLAGTLLDQVDLSGADLSGVDLTGASLRGATLDGADLSKARLSNADLTGASLRKVIWTGASLAGAVLDEADLSASDLSGADLSNTKMIGTLLDAANLENANLTNADLTGVSALGVQLAGANLVGATGLTDTILAGWLEVGESRLASELSRQGIRLESRDAILKDLEGVCLGTGVPESAAYDPGEGFHPMVILNAEGKTNDLTGDAPAIWEPVALRFTQLVACVGKQEREEYGTCSYTSGATYHQYQYQLEVKVFAAQTGAVVMTRVMYGSSPPSCPSKILRSSGPGDLEGDRVKQEDVMEALNSLVYGNP